VTTTEIALLLRDILKHISMGHKPDCRLLDITVLRFLIANTSDRILLISANLAIACQHLKPYQNVSRRGVSLAVNNSHVADVPPGHFTSLRKPPYQRWFFVFVRTGTDAGN
jgi:hypothetical protein